MARRQLLRKPADRAERNLRLVPPPKRRRRPKRRWKLSRFGVRLKIAYQGQAQLHAWEDEVVMAAIAEMNGQVTVRSMMERHPGRFNEKFLWLTLCRLVGQDRLLTGKGLGVYAGWSWWKKPVNRHRPFWTKERARERARAD